MKQELTTKNSLSKEVGKLIIISGLFVFSIKFFQSFPFQRSFFRYQGLVILGFIGFLLLYFLSKLISNGNFDNFEIFLIFIAFFFPIYSSFRATLIFEQPIIYGLLKERIWLTLIIGIIILYKLSIKKWDIQNMKNTFLLLSWFSLVLFVIIYLFTDPNQFERSFATHPLLKGVHYKFNPYFVNFGLIFYFLMFIEKRKIIYLLKFFPFASYIIFLDKGRGLIITIGVTLILLVYSRSRFKLRNLVIFILIFVILFLIIIVFFPNMSTRYANSFKPLFELFKEPEIKDISLASSAKARVFQLHKLFNFLEENPGVILWGCGSLSNRWDNGFSGKFNYFFPSDLGIIGVWFVYGMFGIALLLIFVFFIFSGTSCNKLSSLNYNSLKFFLIFLLIRSILTGLIFFNPSTIIIPGSIFYWLRKNSN